MLHEQLPSHSTHSTTCLVTKEEEAEGQQVGHSQRTGLQKSWKGHQSVHTAIMHDGP